MNTPNVITVLPGDRHQGPEPEGYMTRDAFIDMVVDYAKRHELPVREQTRVEGAYPAGGRFEVVTSCGTAQTGTIVVATGNLKVPRRPDMSVRMPASVNQIDGSGYRSPDALPPGAVLVINRGNSGGQIAEDAAQAGRRGSPPSYGRRVSAAISVGSRSPERRRQTEPPVQERCVSVHGVYSAGLDTLESLRAGTVLAAAEEAERISGHISANGK